MQRDSMNGQIREATKLKAWSIMGGISTDLQGIRMSIPPTNWSDRVIDP